MLSTCNFNHHQISSFHNFSTKFSSSKLKSTNSIAFKFPVHQFQIRATLNDSLNHPQFSSSIKTRDFHEEEKPRVLLNSLRVLEWDKVCDIVSSFAGTSLGRKASKEQLWALDQTYEESLWLLRETNAAIEIHKYSNGMMNFSSIDDLLVRSAIDCARRNSPVSGQEAVAVATLLQFAETLQSNIKSAIKENADLHKRFMPLAELIVDLFTNKSLVRSILQVVDEDGSIKDSASPKLKQARWRVWNLENKLNQLMNAVIANENNQVSGLEASNIDGRWCIRSITDQPTSIQGLLLSSGSGVGNSIEPVSAVPLNDELLEAKASVADAETEVLMNITEKMKMDLDNIETLLRSVVELDVVNARARYGLSMRGTFPELVLLDDKNDHLCSEGFFPKGHSVELSYSSKKQLKLCLREIYHPLLLQHHQHSLQEARKDVANATSELRRRRLYGGNIPQGVEQIDLHNLKEKVAQLEKAHPVPVDFLVDYNTKVVLITGPNTGGKTVCLKAVGLSALMAKAGLYVLCSEPAKVPWFDSVFADIGDEQSLSQSLSTFSGHLRQISDIQAKSTNQSLVLLDEVGAGTNPQEGAALGISVLESFAVTGALLTLATTHHGELKTLKYSNESFENACMEFDDVNLKPTYKILWGVPGRSNAINIAERLGLPKMIVQNARELYGTASAVIDEVIFELEKSKQNVEENILEAQHYWMVSKNLHEKLLQTQRKLTEHDSDLRYGKMRQISDFASKARSALHRTMQERRESARQNPNPARADMGVSQAPAKKIQHSAANTNTLAVKTEHTPFVEEVKQSPTGARTKTIIPSVGNIVQISSLGTKATVLQVDSSKGELVVQAGKLKLKLKLSDIKV